MGSLPGPLYILHDFDVTAFSIAKTLHQSNRRFQFATTSGEDFRVVDFGLRLADVERLGLESERVVVDKGHTRATNRGSTVHCQRRSISSSATVASN